MKLFVAIPFNETVPEALDNEVHQRVRDQLNFICYYDCNTASELRQFNGAQNLDREDSSAAVHVREDFEQNAPNAPTSQKS